MWVLLRPPRFGGAKHASGHDNRSRYRQVCFSNMQPCVKEKAPRRRGPNSEPKRREGCVPTTRVCSRFVPDICIILGVVTATARQGQQWPSRAPPPVSQLRLNEHIAPEGRSVVTSCCACMMQPERR